MFRELEHWPLMEGTKPSRTIRLMLLNRAPARRLSGALRSMPPVCQRQRLSQAVSRFSARRFSAPRVWLVVVSFAANSNRTFVRRQAPLGAPVLHVANAWLEFGSSCGTPDLSRSHMPKRLRQGRPLFARAHLSQSIG